MMKKSISLLVLLACLLPVMVWAAEIVDSGSCGAQGDNLTWTLDSDGLLTVSGSGEMADNVWYNWDNIKSVSIGPGVTSIGEKAFQICSILKSVTISDDVERIDKGAFRGCESLTDLTIGSGVKSIGESAFDECNSLTTVTIPDSVETIDTAAFAGCLNLKSITIGSNVKSINNYAFASCESLTSVTIPGSVETLGLYAFYRCLKLTSVTIGSGVKFIYHSVFEDCFVLSDIWYPGTKSSWDEIKKADYWDRETPGSKKIHCLPESGTGADGDPYIITEADHWDTLAYFVNDGTIKANRQHFRLNESITVSTMLGTSGHPFSGTFNGNGKTLTFNAENTDENTSVAPFAQTSGATIRNLHVAGEITGKKGRAAGLIGENTKTSQVVNCRVSLSVSGSYCIAGFLVGEGSGGVQFTGCVFDGAIQSTDTGGGFAGWSEENSHLRFTDCVFAPSSASFTKRSGTFFYDEYNSGTQSLTNCYYLTPAGTVQGKQTHAVTAIDGVTIDFGKAKTQYGVSGIATYTSGLKYGKTFYAGANETVSMSLSAEMPQGKLLKGITAGAGMLTQNGNRWTLAMPDEDVAIKAEYVALEGAGTESNPWKISSAEIWDALVFSMENGFKTDETFFALTKDVSVTTMLGKPNHPFNGTFDGAEHTLTFSLENQPEITAPFRYINGATIRNLHVTGSVTGPNPQASGLIGENSGESKVTNCRVSMTLSGSMLIGGFCVGAGTGQLSITGCTFDGKIMDGPEQSGCFVAWGTSGLGITDSIAAPQSGSAFDGGTFCYQGNGAPTLNNCYYLTPIGMSQGKQVHAVKTGTDAAIRAGDQKPAYSVSGITFYKTGLVFDKTFYAEKGDTIRPYGLVKDGEYAQIKVDDQKLTRGEGGWQFIMPDKDVTVTAQIQPIPAFGAPAFTLPKQTVTISNNAFAGISAETVYVQDGCKTIPAGAFKNCKMLKLVRLPKGCTVMDGAFSGCESLVGIYAPEDAGIRQWANENGIGYKVENKL